MAIHFHYEHSTFNLKNHSFIKSWINQIIQLESKIAGELCFVFVSENDILEINRKYLNKDYFTDIITFDYTEKNSISGDIFISVDTVMFNAEKFEVAFNHEMKRVIIHGVLHLLGYNDMTEYEKKKMKEKEDNCLNLLNESK